VQSILFVYNEINCRNTNFNFGELENLNPNSESVLLLNGYISETSELETSDSDIFQDYLYRFRELLTDL